VCFSFRSRHQTIAHVLEDVPKVLAVAVHKDAAIVADILRVPAADLGVKKRVRDSPECLHRRLESVPSDIELNVAFVSFSVLVHGRHLAPEISTPRIDLVKGLGTLLGNFGETLDAIFGDFSESPDAHLLSLLQDSARLSQNTLHRRLQ
jgi:hypothetical protein